MKFMKTVRKEIVTGTSEGILQLPTKIGRNLLPLAGAYNNYE